MWQGPQYPNDLGNAETGQTDLLPTHLINTRL
jgi:hypothetical protein